VVTSPYWYVLYDHNGTFLGTVATLHPSDKWWWRGRCHGMLRRMLIHVYM